MIYTVISISYLLLFSLISLFMLPYTWILRKIDRNKGDMAALRYVQWGFRCVTATTGMRVTIEGREHLITDRPVLYVVNHRSIFDVVVSYGYMPTLTGYISKEEIGKIPVISPWMRRLYCLFLPRDDIKQSLQVILTAIDQVKAGISMTIFPEGTRNKGSEPLLPFKGGAFKPAEKTLCPVVPVVLSYDGPVLEQSFPFLKKMRVILRFGEPIVTEGLSREALKQVPETAHSHMYDMVLANEKELGLMH